nr:MAG TPA: hypothetical protein [Caudoviricetes sp.]
MYCFWRHCRGNFIKIRFGKLRKQFIPEISYNSSYYRTRASQ